MAGRFSASLLAAILLAARLAAAEEVQLNAELERLISRPDVAAITCLVGEHHEALKANPDLAALAVIALRAGGNAKTAAAFATRMRASMPSMHRRLLYEEGFSYMQAGDCPRALPSMRYLVSSSGGDDSLRTDAAGVLAACAGDMAGWQKNLHPTLGYSDNLSGVAARKTITPESGSRIDAIRAALVEAMPEAAIPHTITLGEKPVSGAWFGGKGRLMRIRHDGGMRQTVRLTGEARIASRPGYRQVGVVAETTRAAVAGPIRPVTVFALSMRHASRPSGLKPISEIALVMDQSWRFVMPYNFDGFAGLRTRIGRTRSHGSQNFARSGGYIGITHLPGAGQGEHGWRAEIFLGNQTGSQYHAASIRRAAIGLGPFDTGGGTGGGAGGGLVTFGHSLEWLAYHRARPWLSHPHKETRRVWHVRLTYPLGQVEGRGRRLRWNISYTDRASRDVLDNGSKLAMDMEFLF